MDNQPTVDPDRHPLSRVVLEWSDIHEEQVARGDATIDSWTALAALADTDAFERIGTYRERMDWREFIAFVTDFARQADWSGTFQRITELPDRVILELEERVTPAGGETFTVNTASIFEFTADRKVRRLAVYMQAPEQGIGQGNSG